MKTLLGFAAISFFLLLPAPLASAQTGQQPTNSDSPASYQDAVKKLEAGDLSVDFQALRMKYAASEEYDPEEGSEQLNEMYGKLNSKDYDGALKVANAVLAK